MEDKELLENEELEEQEEELEEITTEETPKETTPSFKDIVIKECKRIIAQYKKLMADSDDWKLKLGFEDNSKSEDECVNHIMNNLVAKRIYGGEDSLMYEYIHEYYVDNIKAKDNWSDRINNNRGQQQPKAELTEEQKAKLLKKAEEDFLREQTRKLEEEERKRVEKEKEKLRKQKEREAEKETQKIIEKHKAIEEAKANGGGEQMSIFDF